MTARAIVLVAVVAVSACLDRRPVLPPAGVDVDVRVRVGRAALAGVAHACTCCEAPPTGASCVCPPRGDRR